MSLLASLAAVALAAPARADIAIAGTPFVLTAPDGPVPKDVADATVSGLGGMQRYARRQLGVGVKRRTTVRMLLGDQCDPRLPAVDPRAGAVTAQHLICLFSARSAYPSAPDRRAEVAAHEAVHVLQGELGCFKSPIWLLEGMAEDLGWRVALGYRHYDRLLAAGEVNTQYNGLAKHGLRTHELSMAGLSYPEAALAAITAEGGKPQRFIAFCRAVGRGVLWPKAFKPAFGVDINTFYARFADLRHELAAE